MKIFIVGFFVAFSLVCFGQNWEIVTNGYTYYYEKDNGSIQTIFGASNTTNNDLIMNPLSEVCDSCIFFHNQYYVYYGLYSFLGERIHKENNYTIVLKPKNYVLKPLDNLNSTWVFDSLNNITAEVISKTEALVFGVNDSVKTILLSTNDTIQISKSFGVIKFNYLSEESILKGIRTYNSELGYRPKNFKDFYSFNVGDVFQYTEKEFDGSTSQFTTNRTRKIEILEKIETFNSLSYTIQDSYKDEFYVNSFGIDTVTWSFNNSKNNLANKYDGEINSFSIIHCFFGKYRIVESNGLSRTFGADVFTVLNDTFLVLEEVQYGREYIKIEEGLGVVFQERNCFEQEFKKELVGYIKNGVQTGEVWDDWRFTGLKEIDKVNNLFSIYPNPAKDKLELSLIDIYSEINIQITNVLGESIFKTSLINKKSIAIDLTEFDSGLYFVKVETDKNYSVKRFLKR